MNKPDLIKQSTDAAVTLSGLGENGFILFAIATVALMLFAMGFVAYKSQKMLFLTLSEKHDENEESIILAHEKIQSVQTANNDCLKRLDTATKKLDGCTTRLEGCFEKLRGPDAG